MTDSPRTTESSVTRKATPRRTTKPRVSETTADQRASARVSNPPVMEIIQTQLGETNMETATPTVSNSPVLNGVKVASEALVVPGASLLLDGNVKGGTTHIVAAV